MRSRRRFQPRPMFGSYGNLRVLSMICMLAVLWMLYQRAADPQTWGWLAELDPQPSDDVVTLVGNNLPSGETPPAPPEVVVPTPGADDPEEADAAREEYQAVGDRAPLDLVEMPAYWRQMRWSRGQTFAELEKTARRDVLFTDLWEQPEKHRGELIRLRLHIKRTLSFEAPETNTAGVKRVYEAWGWTEESRSFPYVVVFADLPPQMPLGPDIHEEAVFVGYFLKLMSYQAFDNHRAAPLLVGRLKWQPNPARVALQKPGAGYFLPTAAAGGVLVLAIVGGWILKWRRRHRVVAPAETGGLPGDQWWQQVQGVVNDSPESDNPLAEINHGQRFNT